MIEYATKWNTTLVDPKHPALHGECTVNPLDTDIVWQTVEQEMFKLMHERIGIGLAAPQLGNPVKMFVMTHSTKGDIGVYNPEILSTSDNNIALEEGCLTWPVLYMHITRPESCVVRYQTINKETIEEELTGIDARCFLHEFDHLQGKIFLDYASDFKLQRAIKKRDKRIREFMRAHKMQKEIMK